MSGASDDVGQSLAGLLDDREFLYGDSISALQANLPARWILVSHEVHPFAEVIVMRGEVDWAVLNLLITMRDPKLSTEGGPWVKPSARGQSPSGRAWKFEDANVLSRLDARGRTQLLGQGVRDLRQGSLVEIAAHYIPTKPGPAAHWPSGKLSVLSALLRLSDDDEVQELRRHLAILRAMKTVEDSQPLWARDPREL